MNLIKTEIYMRLLEKSVSGKLKQNSISDRILNKLNSEVNQEIENKNTINTERIYKIFQIVSAVFYGSIISLILFKYITGYHVFEELIIIPNGTVILIALFGLSLIDATVYGISDRDFRHKYKESSLGIFLIMPLVIVVLARIVFS